MTTDLVADTTATRTSAIHLGPATVEPSELGSLVTATISVPGQDPWPIWFDVPAARVSAEQGADAFFCLATIIAQTLEHPLIVESAVSPLLLHDAGTLQRIFEMWHSSTPAIPITASVRRKDPQFSRPRHTAVCFSGGVDSMHSLLTSPTPVRYGVFVRGYDIGIKQEKFTELVSARLTVTAADLGFTLLEPRTNLVEFTRGVVPWGDRLHGAALAAVGILLADMIDVLVVPSSGASSSLSRPNGSHHASDRLHDTEYFQTLHHGTFVSRGEKTATITVNEAALRDLRVCNRSRRSFNCGGCPKCVRTKLELEIIGSEFARVPDFEIQHDRSELVPLLTVSSVSSPAYPIARASHRFAVDEGASDIAEPLGARLAELDAQEACERLLELLPTIPAEDIQTELALILASAAAYRE